jgi:arsenite-transporting ATPase
MTHVEIFDPPMCCSSGVCGPQVDPSLPSGLGGLPRTDVPLLPWAPLGIEALRRVFAPPVDGPGVADVKVTVRSVPGPISTLVDEIARVGRGVVLTMGKGGVGKTTTAAAIAVELAALGHDVYLSTTDRAAHVAAAIGGAVPRLRVSRIDPAAETQAYSEEVVANAASTLDARGLDLLKEDLRSPCTEEIAVFRAFARVVAEGEQGIVVLDTAPTGHTLLLLDAAEAYHREVSRAQGSVPEAVRRLLPRLRDPQFTKVLLVTVPEATPVHEAARLQDDLRRAGIEPFAWIVNQSFAGAGISDPVLRERGRREHQYLDEVCERLAARVAWVPWYPDPPVGPVRLRQFVRAADRAALAPVS